MMANLVDEGARSEAHSRVLYMELGDTEEEMEAMRASLANALHGRFVAERNQGTQVAHLTEELGAERKAATRMRDELKALQEEHDGVVSRLQASQRANEEWRERVFGVGKEFEARTNEWQEQLRAEAAKWRALNDGLKSKLAAAEARGSQAMSMEEEIKKLDARLRLAHEEEEQLRKEKREVLDIEADLRSKLTMTQNELVQERRNAVRAEDLAAKDDELKGVRHWCESSTAENNTLKAQVSDLESRLLLAQRELSESLAQRQLLTESIADSEARWSVQHGSATEFIAQLQSEVGEQKAAVEVLKAVGEEREEELREQARQLEERLMVEAEELQSELNEALEETEAQKSARLEVEALYEKSRQTEHDEREMANQAWEDAMSSALREKDAALKVAGTQLQEARVSVADLERKLKLTREELSASETAVETLHGANSALERRATVAEARCKVAEESLASMSPEYEAALKRADETDARTATSVQESEAALARAMEENEEMRSRIRQLIEHHTDHQAQAEVDAEDAAMLRAETGRLHAQVAALEAALADERNARQDAEDELMRAEEAAGGALVGEGSYQTARMVEQRQRIEAMAAELEASRAELEESRNPRKGFFGEALQPLLRSIGEKAGALGEKAGCVSQRKIEARLPPPLSPLSQDEGPDERGVGSELFDRWDNSRWASRLNSLIGTPNDARADGRWARPSLSPRAVSFAATSPGSELGSEMRAPSPRVGSPREGRLAEHGAPSPRARPLVRSHSRRSAGHGHRHSREGNRPPRERSSSREREKSRGAKGAPANAQLPRRQRSYS